MKRATIIDREVSHSEVFDLIGSKHGISDVEIAMELSSSVPAVKKILTEIEATGAIYQNQKEEWVTIHDGIFNDESGTDPNHIQAQSSNNSRVTYQSNRQKPVSPSAETALANNRSVLAIETTLTEEETKKLLWLERKIERGFYEAGKALQEIRDSRLYRDRYRNFNEYLEGRFGFKRHYANRQIAAAEIFDILACTTELEQSPNGTQSVTPTGTETEKETNGLLSGTPTGTPILPNNERQIRPLSQIEPDQRREVWLEAVKKAGGKVPSEKIVRELVRERKLQDTCKAPNPFQAGQVVTAKHKKGWFVVKDAGEFTCTLHSPTGEKAIVSHFDVRTVELPREQREFMANLQTRLADLWHTCDQIPNPQESSTAKSVLEAIAFNLGGGFLSELQKSLLELIENSVEF